MQTQPAQIEPSASTSSGAEPVLVAVDPARLVEVAPLVAPLIDSIALRSRGRYTSGAMIDRIVRGEWVLWVIWSGEVEGIVITEVYDDVSSVRCCMIRACTGRNADRWTHLLARIEDYARAAGCRKLDMMARKGWAKRLPHYKLTHVVLEKDLF